MSSSDKLLKDHAEAFFILGWKKLENMDILNAQDFDMDYIKTYKLNFKDKFGVTKGLLIFKLEDLGYIEIKQDMINLPYIIITKEGRDFIDR